MRKKIVFLHPDLGIGSAERLVIDAALALQSRDFDVQFVTSHHDPDHCLPETKNGTLKVSVCGDWLPRKLFGRCYALCAYIRMFFLALCVCFTENPEIVFCDQISACIPLIRCLRPSTKVVFYCHFPDLRLTTRKTWIKKLYRWPIDRLEEYSTGKAHRILVNSKFTEGIFRETFRSLGKVEVQVLHPSLHMTSFDSEITEEEPYWPESRQAIFLSINRFERKKNIRLAIEALCELQKILSLEQWGKVHLVVAGGYDPLVAENSEYLYELQCFSEV